MYDTNGTVICDTVHYSTCDMSMYFAAFASRITYSLM
jgi:hypothetical protein